MYNSRKVHIKYEWHTGVVSALFPKNKPSCVRSGLTGPISATLDIQPDN